MHGPQSPSLLAPLQDDTKNTVVENLFGRIESKRGANGFAKFLENYSRELRQLSMGVDHVSRATSGLAAKTHEDIFHICSTLTAGKSMPRREIRKLLSLRFRRPQEDDLSIDRLIDLTLRLWLMLNVRGDELSILTPQTPALHWDDGFSLEQFISMQFPQSTTELTIRESRLDPSFTAANMVRICSLHIKWTASLEDHLRLDRRRKILSVFPFKDFLVGHLEAVKTLEDGIKRLRPSDKSALHSAKHC